jgi:3-hydroxybutyrate dehydrogenase
MGTLSGKVAAVTGSTSGIGLAIAEALAAGGADVALNGFGDAAAIEAMRARIAADHGVRCIHLGSDMSTGAGAAGFVEQVAAELGSVDILVNNVGIQHVAPVDEFPPEKWDALIAIILGSTFHTTRVAVPGMRAKGWGRIINIASAHGLVASPFKSAYVAAKHGVVGFTKSVALELAETGVTCNAICPGYVRTPLVEGQVADQAKVHGMSEDEVIRNVILAVQPTKRFVEPGEIGAFAAFLASDAARSITGAALSIDGGWTTR